jgi:tetratricopeptide (TPR) repeat protein
LEKRLAMFDEYAAVASGRDDTLAREAVVRVLAGQYDKALDLLGRHTFHIWEGASITVHGTYVDAHLLRGHEHMKAGRYSDALRHYRAALEYPENLGEGKPRWGDRSPAIYYHIAAARSALGDAADAAALLRRAADEAGFGRNPEVLYHRGLALGKLGDKDGASRAFERLAESGRAMLKRGEQVDHFAKFGDGRPAGAARAQAHFTLGLSCLGNGDLAGARKEFQQALEEDLTHLWARHYLSSL